MDKESIKIINEAIALQLRKSDDYQNKESWIKQADYYPRGVLTILDIVYAKVLRMYSVVEWKKILITNKTLNQSKILVRT